MKVIAEVKISQQSWAFTFGGGAPFQTDQAAGVHGSPTHNSLGDLFGVHNILPEVPVGTFSNPKLHFGSGAKSEDFLIQKNGFLPLLDRPIVVFLANYFLRRISLRFKIGLKIASQF